MENNTQKTSVIEALRKEVKRTDIPDVHIGDTVQVKVKIIEGDKERLQAFEGIVIAIDGTGVAKTLKVRRVSHGNGVERIFPLASPLVASVKVTRKGLVRRAKLYYLRHKVGTTKIKERRDK